MIFPMEEIWQRFENRYKAINLACLEARRIKEEQAKGTLAADVNPILEALRHLMAGKLRTKE